MKLKHSNSVINRLSRSVCLFIILLSLIHFYCSPEPEPIKFGHDQCMHCKMIISDARYGAELVTDKGKIYKFDAVECLAAFFLERNLAAEDIHSLWVINFGEPQNLIDAGTAMYLHSAQLPSPMGLNLTAFAGRSSAEKLSKTYPGTIIEWQDVQFIVSNAWINKKR